MTAPGNPVVKIISPVADQGYVENDVITFQASAHDANGNSIADSNIVWTDNIDGTLGTGSILQHTLSAGVPAVHYIKVTVTNSAGRMASDTVRIYVASRIT
jgi:hypothetical protein